MFISSQVLAQNNNLTINWDNLDILLEASDIDSSDYDIFVDYLDNYGQEPTDYIVEKCKTHQLVILGEWHHLIEYERFVRDIIPDLYYKAGVRYIVFESIIVTHNGKTEALVTGKEYDESLALEIAQADGYSDWGDKEYWDILKAIWELNINLPKDSEPMHAIGMEIPKDYKLDKLWQRNQIENKDLIARAESQHLLEMLRDENMAAAVEQYVLNKGGKGLVLVGQNHSFTHYSQPFPNVHDPFWTMPFSNKVDAVIIKWPRMGTILYQEYGDRIFQIGLHGPHTSPRSVTEELSSLTKQDDDSLLFRFLSASSPQEQPVIQDLVEKIMTERGNVPVGFDVVNSPFANLRDRRSYYFHFQPSVRLSDLNRGYIFLKPWKDLTFSSWMEGYVSQDLYDNNKIYRMYYDLLYHQDWKNAQEIDNWYRDSWLKLREEMR